MVQLYCKQFLYHIAMVKWYSCDTLWWNHTSLIQGSYNSKMGEGAEVRW